MTDGSLKKLQDIPEKALVIVSEIRSLEPSRAVRSSRGSVSGRYPSRKMGVTIQFESHKNELAFILELEHDPKVIEYYDQPNPIPLSYLTKAGNRIDVFHTPDFFVIGQDWIGWVECKTEEDLKRLAPKQPNRILREGSGWRCPPGEVYAAGFSLGYRLRSSAEIDWTFQRNVAFLEDYLRMDEIELPQVHLDLVESFVRASPGISLRNLLDLFESNGIPSDRLYSMMVTDRLYVDLTAASLSEPDRVRLFAGRDEASEHPLPSGVTAVNVGRLEPNQVLIWDERPVTLLHRGDESIWLQEENGHVVSIPEQEFVRLIRSERIRPVATDPHSAEFHKIRERLLGVAPARLEEATRRKAALNEPVPAVAERTRFRWQAHYRQAEREIGEGYFGLIPATEKRGNRRRKMPTETIALTEKYIAERYENSRQPNIRSVWAKLAAACREAEIPSPSYETFRLMTRKRPEETQITARKGKRAAYAVHPVILELERTTPRHGERPFEIGHIDHTELDIELVCSETGLNLGRPWMTLLTDAFSRRVLAFRLSFESPSYRACMGVIRECVRRFQCLPTTLVTDGGAEFQGSYYDALLARFEIIKKTRPPSQSRFGSVCERFFGTANSRFIHTLAGNTQLTVHNVRFAAGKNNPKKLAVWTFERLHEHLVTFLYEVYDTLDHPALGQSPREAFQKGRVQGGVRESRIIHDDLNFRLMTMPTTPKGTAVIVPGKGVKINGIYYLNVFFRGLPKEMPQVDVRYDPDDIGHAWAFLQKQWMECQSEYYPIFQGRSESEIKIASAEIRKRLSAQNRKSRLSVPALAEFLKSTDQAEMELLGIQRLRNLAQRKVVAGKRDVSTRTAAPVHVSPAPPPALSETFPDEKIEFSIEDLEILGELE